MRWIRIIGGYVAAATCVMATILHREILAGGETYFRDTYGFAFFFILPVFTALFVIAAIFCEYRSIRNILYYTTSSVTACLIAFLALHANLTIELLAGIAFETPAILAGLAGGLVYWAISGRHAGHS